MNAVAPAVVRTKILEQLTQAQVDYMTERIPMRRTGTPEEKKAAQLLATLKDPLRAELTDLLRRQLKFDAIKKYQAAASVDLSTAAMVINALQKSTQ